MQKGFCPNCENVGIIEPLLIIEVIKVQGVDIRTRSNIYRCSICMKNFATEKQEEENIQRAYRKYDQIYE